MTNQPVQILSRGFCPTCGSELHTILYQGTERLTHAHAAYTKVCRLLPK